MEDSLIFLSKRNIFGKKKRKALLRMLSALRLQGRANFFVDDPNRFKDSYNLMDALLTFFK
jgi:hypothetical protein